MSVPYNDDTRQSYIKRMEEGYVHIAHVHYELKQERSMWLALLYYAMAEDLYGEHWDYLQRRKT